LLQDAGLVELSNGHIGTAGHITKKGRKLAAWLHENGTLAGKIEASCGK
jgi:hypothetical protein